MDFSKVKNVVTYYEQNVFPKRMNYYKAFYLDTSDRESRIKKWQTNLSSGLMTRVVSTFVAHLYDHTFKFYISRHNDSEKDLEKSEVIDTALSWAYHASKTKSKVIESFIDTVLLGEGYGKVYMMENKKKVEYYKKVKKTDDKGVDVVTHVKESFKMKDLEIPAYEYKSPFMCMLEPYATDFDDAYIIEIKHKRKQEIKNDYSAYVPDKKKNAEMFGDDAFEQYKNSEQVLTENRQMKKMQYITGGTDSTLNEKNETYKLYDEDHKYEVVEIWTNEKLTVFVGGKEIFSDMNPYPIKRKPHLQIRYSRAPGTIRGLGLGFYLEDYDKLATELINTYVDDSKMKSVPVLVEVVGAGRPQSVTGAHEFHPGQIIQVESEGALSALNFGGANIQLRDLLGWLMQEAFMIAGINEIVMGAPLIKVDRSATSTTGRIQGFKSRMMELFDSINDAFANMGEMRLGMMVSMDIKKVHFFDEETKKTVYKDITIDDIKGQYDVIFDMQPLKTSMKELLLQKKINFLQVAQGFVIDPATRKPLVKIKEIIEDIANAMDISSDIFFSEEEIQKLMDEMAAQAQGQMPAPGAQPAPGAGTPMPQGEEMPVDEEGGVPGGEVHNQLLEDALNPSV